MGKYLIVAPGYPSKENKYNNGFVHSRAIQYKKEKLNVQVFSLTKGDLKNYNYEGINVAEGNSKAFSLFLRNNKYDKILIHFGYKKILKPIIKECPNTPLIIWVHGAEALGWYRRLFAFNIRKPHRFFCYILLNIRQMLFLHNFIKNKKIDKTFVFVSNWMRDVLEKDSFSKNKITNYYIIPNVINSEQFNYVKKTEKDRLNILSIRSFQSKKYANDLSVKAILELSKEPFFNELTFTFYGNGRLFNRTMKPLYKFNNVKIYKTFLSQDEISEVHKKNGIILMPTRQDAQGVSMCEGMSSGLVPITSNNTAIPEFVTPECGYLTDNYKSLAVSIKKLYNDPKTFFKMSENSSKFIQNKCNSKASTAKEINIIKN